MAYIDRDKAVSYFENHRRIGLHKDDIVAYLSSLPTADVAEVVRCKDCKYYVYGKCDKISYIMDGYYQGGFEVKTPNDFCSYGERR